MSVPLTKVGIDLRGDLFYVARVEHQPARYEIKALLRLERQHLGEHHLMNGAGAVLSMPDEMVMVKRISLNGSNDIDQRTRFELMQSLPEDRGEYLFDIKESGLEKHYLGMAIRRDRLHEYKTRVLGDRIGVMAEAGYEMRAAALASGYTEFCRKSGGDLICLADFTAPAVSVAFVYQNMLTDLTSLPLGKYELDDPAGFRRMAVELKTLVNFRTGSLFSDGITTPLSGLVVSGDDVSEEFLDRLKGFFSIDVTRPQINTGFFSGEADLTSVPLEKYLVALGLAAK